MLAVVDWRLVGEALRQLVVLLGLVVPAGRIAGLGAEQVGL